MLHMDNDNDPNRYISYELAEDESDDEEEFRLRQIAVVGAVLYLGAEESRHEHLARRKARMTEHSSQPWALMRLHSTTFFLPDFQPFGALLP
jgi:hypothetical protein